MSGVKRWQRSMAIAVVLAVSSAVGGPSQAAGSDFGTGRLLVPDPETSTVTAHPPFKPAGATAITGAFVGDTPYGSTDDILWYTPGPGGDALWESRPGGTWRSHPISITGTFEPVVGRFAAGDVQDDIIWYAPGSHPDELWDFNQDGTITKKALSIKGDFEPIVGRFSQLGVEDIIWYAPGPAPDAWWSFGPNTSITSRPLTINGRYQPLVGHFGCFDAYGPDTFADVLWYGAGAAPDAIWDFRSKHAIARTSITINGTYKPVVGAFTDDLCTDVIWYAPGKASDSMWDYGASLARPTSVPLKIDGHYRPVSGNLFPSSYGYTDVLWFGPGSARDVIWDYSSSGGPPADRTVDVDGDRTPVVGFFTTGHESIIDLSS
ncbi:hypothetical protein ACE2AJ_15050 [Aquihabitans daechungensis]|uniref:hypothetical protein n=1 Tax=Aquihabitans daechungensis TaxID=1052257 RepID=UPI003B9EC51A